MYDVIEKKRNGYPLAETEIQYFVQGYTNNEIPDYQISALLMAIYFQGMTTEECASLTMAMVQSGVTVDLSAINGVKVDKHSTGGVGDTTTLILAPLVASAGVSVAKMSGRGLGHTGGTLDKLESINGFHIDITNEEFIDLVNRNHVAVIGQTDNLVPADKLLYSLRDVTATVSSIPLIASSIMSKKIASGSDAIVLDVKTGNGAFMKDIEDAKKLAKTMVAIGEKVGRKTVAVISSMEQPLGYAVGNALEIKEAIATLQGKGPEDLTELTIELGSHMLVLAHRVTDLKEAKQILREKITNGAAIEYFKKFIQAQGGDPRVVEEPERLPKATYTSQVYASKSGIVSELIADKIGTAAMLLGAGRQTKESEIDLAVGVLLHKKLGEYVEKGECLFTIHSNDKNIEHVEKLLLDSITLSDKVNNHTLIHHIIDNSF